MLNQPEAVHQFALPPVRTVDLRKVFAAALYIVSAYLCPRPVTIYEVCNIFDEAFERVEIVAFSRLCILTAVSCSSSLNVSRDVIIGDTVVTQGATTLSKATSTKYEGVLAVKKINIKVLENEMIEAVKCNAEDVSELQTRHFGIPNIVICEALAYVRLALRPSEHVSQLLGMEITQNSIYFVQPFYPLSYSVVFCTHAGMHRGAVFAQQRFKELCLAVQALHGAGIAHRDIKPQNMMFRADQTLVLLDFGLASTTMSTMRTTTPVVTVMTRSYELLVNGDEPFEYDAFKVDMWSLGCMLFSMHHRRLQLPFAGYAEDAVLASIRDAHNIHKVPLGISKWLGEAGVSLFWRLVSLDPRDRPTIDEVLEDNYFK